MKLTLEIFGLVSCLELLLWLPAVWRFRKWLAGAVLLSLSVLSGMLLVEHLSGWVVLLVIFNLYRIVGSLRVMEGRIQADYLYHASRRTALSLSGLQLLLLVVVAVSEHYHVNSSSWFGVLVGGQLAGAGLLLAAAVRQLRTTRPPTATDDVATRDLPSLTVAIPARNETDDLEACLQSLVASTYPKLEILVLDDCSQNKRTPEIIRGLAHDGVTFLAGKVPPDEWLAKNYAYAQLTEAANGELLLFCGVDARFEPDSLTQIVKIMLMKHKTMLSLLPRNLASRRLTSLLLQPSRYAWELALPRRLLKRPPVLSTCWIIRHETLKAAGGFAAAARKTVPESYLARHSAAYDDGYSFLQADTGSGLTSHKSFAEQRDTAIRTRYPQLHRRPELVAVVCLLEFTVLVWPYIVVVTAAVLGSWPLVVFAALACLANTVWYARVVNLTYRRFSGAGLWFLPLAALYDIGVLNYSMWQYEFQAVLWKGRNVCLPVMRVVPHLPALDRFTPPDPDSVSKS